MSSIERLFSPLNVCHQYKIFQMDDKRAFNEDFDEVIDDIIHRMNNTKKYEAREIIFDLRKR